MGKKKYIFIGLFVFFFLFLLFGYIFLVNRKVQEERLFNDVEEFSKQDVLIDRSFPISTVSSNYKDVEILMEKYMDNFYHQYDKVMGYANDKKLTSLLSVSNYMADGPNFDSSLKYVQETRDAFDDDMNKLFQFIKKKKAGEVAEKSSLSIYYQKLFISSMNESSLNLKLQSYEEVFLKSENQMNNVFNTIINTLNFLKNNRDNWKIENNEIQFSTEDLVNQYNSLVSTII